MTSTAERRAVSRCLVVVTALASAVTATSPCSSAGAQYHSGWAVGETADGYATIVHTTDSGVTWQRQGSPAVVPAGQMASVSAADARTAWVVGSDDQDHGVILHTRDGGLTWERQGMGEIPDGALQKVRAVDARVAWAVGGVVGGSGVVLRTLDGGETWVRLDGGAIEVPLQGLDPLDAHTAWVSSDEPVNGEAVIFHTTDGGNTWETQGAANGLPADAGFLGISAVDADTVWAVGGSGYLIYHTLDGGRTWSRQDEDAPGGFQDSNEVCALDRNTAWVAQDMDSMRFTQDGGETWVPRGPDPATGHFMMSVSAITAEIVWAVGPGLRGPPGVIIHTRDGGNTWDQQEYPGGANLWNVSMISGFLDQTYFVPAVALAAGAEGASFVTDVEINNAGTAAMSYQLMYVARGASEQDGLVSDTYTLGAGRSMRHENVLSGVFGLDSGLGALVVMCNSDDALLMSRTYNLADDGTFGQGIPGYHTGQLNAEFDPVRILFMTEDDDYRSNLGIMNATDVENLVAYELFDANGVSLGTGEVTLPPYGNIQVNHVFGDGADVVAAYVDVWSETEGGLFVCYGSMLDNITSDPTTLLPQ